MARSYTHETTLQIGEASVLLKVAFDFVPGQPETGPSYSSGGEPACPAEVDITFLKWSLDNSVTKKVQWHVIDGPLFDLIASDDDLHAELCQAAEDHDVCAREAAAEAAYELHREA